MTFEPTRTCTRTRSCNFILLGKIANGTGVIQDNVYAHMWWNIAASSGDKNAVTNRDIVAGKMTPSQLEKAKTLPVNVSVRTTKGVELEPNRVPDRHSPDLFPFPSQSPDQSSKRLCSDARSWSMPGKKRGQAFHVGNTRAIGLSVGVFETNPAQAPASGTVPPDPGLPDLATA
jgi:hypothetical protein